MITPLDIQNKEFGKGVRGYKEEDVDGFLDLLTLDWEKLLDENQRLRDQMKAMSTELDRFKRTEGMVLETLEAAKALMGDISTSAEKRAEILLKNAELDAERITREARESVEKLQEESHSLKTRLNVFRTRYRTLLESELEKFDNLSSELFFDKEMDDLKSILDGRTMGIKESLDTQNTADIEFAGKTLVNLRTEDMG